MKMSWTKIPILLLSLMVLSAKSNATSVDTLLNCVFMDSEIRITSGDGELYQYAQNQNGFKYIYYLFTGCNYLHLEATDVTAKNAYYCFYDNDPQAEWYNLETQKTAKSDVKWPLKYEGKKENDTECVKNNPNRCMRRKLGIEEPVRLLFNADDNRKAKADTSSVLLVIMPPFSDAKADAYLCKKISLNYGGANGKKMEDFRKDVEFTERDTLLDELEYVITRIDRAVIDSVLVNGLAVSVKDSLFQDPTIVIPLKSIPIEYGKDIDIDFYYTYFNSNNRIKREHCRQSLPLNWNRDYFTWGRFLLAILALFLVILISVLIIESILSKKGKKNKSNKKIKQKNKSSNVHKADLKKGKIEKEDGVEDGQETEDGVDEAKDGKNHRFLSFLGKLKQHGKDAATNTNPQLGNTSIEDPGGETIPGRQTMEEQIRGLKDELAQKNNDLEAMENSLNGTRKELETANNNLTTELQKFEEKLNLAKTESEKEKQALKDELDKAQKDKITAETALANAENNAKAKFEADKKVLEEECKKKVDEAQTLANNAQENARKAIAAKEKEFAQMLKQWTDDRDAMLNKLKDSVNRFATIVGKMDPEAFNGNCGKIRSGVMNYSESINRRVDEEQWSEMTTGECLAKLRAECCSILDNGTDSWMNLLGRLYSYMSVVELEQRLSVEGLNFELVSDAFVAMQGILASMGIVVLSCSPGFDSSDDPVTASLFVQKSSVDRITNWLEGNATVQEVVPNHGHTVYDFGQLAYFTFDDLTIRQGSVIYYNS